MVVAALCALALSACGTALSHQRIVQASQGGPVVSGGNGSGGAANSADSSGSGDAGTGASGASGSGTSGGGGGTGGGSTGGGGTGGGGGSSSAAGCTSQGSTVVLGSIGNFSGLAGAALPGAQQSVQAWAQYANAHGGLNCHPVKLISADDGGDPARTLSLAKQMVESQGAIGFVGNFVPLSLSGIQPYLESKGVPMVGGDVSLPQWVQSPEIFPSGTDADSFRAAQVKLFGAAGLHKLAILYCGETPSCVQGEKYLVDHPSPDVQIVYTAEISIAQTSFTTECLQAQQKGATAVYVASDGSSLIRIARDCAQQTYHPQYTAASIAVLPQMSSDANLNGLIALIGNAPWFVTNSPGVAAFRQAMAQYAPGAPITASALAGFASGVMVEKAAAALSAHPTAKELMTGLDALQGFTANGLTPPLTFHAGSGSGAVPCYFRIQIQNGNWVAPSGASPICP